MIYENNDYTANITRTLTEVYRKRGVNINSTKTESLSAGLKNEEKLEIDNEWIKKVNKSKYSGSILESDRESYCEIQKRIREGNKAMCMLNLIYETKNIVNATKLLNFKSLLRSVVLYGV